MWSLLAASSDNKDVNTLRLKVDPAGLDTVEAGQALDSAAEILRRGGLVALPTETVYGLGANALDEAAVKRIFEAKQRPVWDPVIVHISDASMLGGLVVDVPEAASGLMKAFWPGPLTLLLPRSCGVPDVVTAGRPLVGVRMPSHPVALELIRRAGVPIAAPSANVFGHISPTTAAHVLHDLDGRIDAVLDAGPTAHGVESTVLDPRQSPMVIYRPGAVTRQQIRDVAGAVEIFKGTGELLETPRQALPSPGVGLRHYAPRARLVLVEGSVDEISLRIAEAAEDKPVETLGVMLPADIALPERLAAAHVYTWGKWSEPRQLARDLYAGLRELDSQGCMFIICPLPSTQGIGAAIRDRLIKAGIRKAENRE